MWFMMMGPARMSHFSRPLFIYILIAYTVLSTDGQSTCQMDICSDSGFGLNCAEGGVLHINHVSCGQYDREGCMVAKHNLLKLCTGQKACNSKGLRKILRPCMVRPWSSVYVRVNYSCVPEAILTRTCSGDLEEEIGNRGAIIMSPGYPDSPTDVKYNFCHWSFRVPVWQNARITIQHLTSRQTMGRCDSPLLQISYTLCNGGAYKTERFCGVVNREKVRHACGRVDILARGFDPQYDAGTKFLVTVIVDYPQNLKGGRGNPMYTTPCGGEPSTTIAHPPIQTVPVVDLISPDTPQNEQGKRLEVLEPEKGSPSKKSSPRRMTRTIKIVLVLTLAGIVIIGLLAAIIVVCHKTTQSGNYKLREAEALAIARKRSRETEPIKFDHVGMNGQKPHKHSPGAMDDDLIIHGLRDRRGDNSPTKQHFMTVDDEVTEPLSSGSSPINGVAHPDVVGHTYSSYASIDDDATGVTSPLHEYPRLALYEDPDSCRQYIPPYSRELPGECDSLDEYDNVPRTSDVRADIEHYNVGGDDYAIVTKNRKPFPSNGHAQTNCGHDLNGGYHVTPKPVYVNGSGDVILADSHVNNRWSEKRNGEIFY